MGGATDEEDTVNPAVTDEEIKQAVDTSSGANPPQVFQQALVGSRTAAAQSALNEAKTRRSELLAIEAQLVELAALMQQVRPRPPIPLQELRLTLRHVHRSPSS